MQPIVTLTMNPALDVTTGTDHVRPTHKLRCTTPRFDPGGGGINVARVIHALGGDATAVFPAGGPSGEKLKQLLTAIGVTIAPVPVAGATRESFTVDEAATGDQYRFVLPGAELTPSERQAIVAALENQPAPPAYIVASGSLPAGVSDNFYCIIGALCRRIGARMILDTSGAALAASEGCDAWLVKPSQREMEDLLGRELPDETAWIDGCRELIARGFATTVALSLGADGAMLVTEKESRRYRAPKVEVFSAVGAGDSMVAAITLALAHGLPVEEAFRHGMAAGAAALLTPATELVHRNDFERLLAQVE
ncbi:1-phosphofructokinase family hexose kinase [Stakelama tenebrarum]|uniref:Phosphofructokinase n=1 Tax=Stakelama tenebrarum TaxID=2711215 RepID=A0A6G6Y416_9SPHN|nr:1-phosphofructokinase family hexose kinase [Sphingosinithalassobacter tenebrarum]QIG79655.1 1-phosphofructokinase family hexose kinase [Sphingosinithalassobacter tenebrarum]